MRTVRWVAAALCGLVVALAVLLSVTPAQASIRTVTLSNTGPSPASLTIAKGDVVRFFNNDTVTHTVSRSAGSWAFKATIAAGQAATTKAFTASGTYGYTDAYTFLALNQSQPGTITVPAASASPTPSATRPATPRPTAPRTTTPSPSARPTAGATPTPVPTGSGLAIGPGLGVGQLPSLQPSATSVPTPDVAPPGATDSASPVPASGPTYADGHLVQSSPHRYGLPAALAAVGVVGVLSLLVRLLLALTARG